MGMKHVLLAGAAALAMSSAALADNHRPNGVYVGLAAGANWADRYQPLLFVNMNNDVGYYVSGQIGWAFESRWRLEGELSYRDNNWNGIALWNGRFNALAIMGNLYYDLPVAERWSASLGVGLGINRVGLGTNVIGSDKSFQFAYQGMAEVGYMATDHVQVFGGYQYHSGKNAKLFTPAFVKDDYVAHTARIGIRYFFAEPAAAPVVQEVVPPTPAKTFIVFFDFNKSNLTAEAQAVIAEAAAAFKASGQATVMVVGHTDTVGSARYNQGLSERRAASVKAGLTAAGVPGEVISTEGRGFTQPLVPTGPGVKEPQNRRATIDISSPSAGM